MLKPSRVIAPSRRDVLIGVGAAAATTVYAAPRASGLTIRDDRPGAPLSPLIFGSNEIGTMDGGPPSSLFDRAAGVTARRLGGNLMTAYNWLSNATNAGKDHRHANGPFLLEALGVPREFWGEPAAVVHAMHEASLAMGAQSLVTVPIAGFVAADFAGAVAEEEAAPSRRFIETRWGDGPSEETALDMRGLIARLISRYGPAGTPRGIFGYALDNEPALWFQNHPRVTPKRITIRAFIDRSLAAARVIKNFDPAAKIFGPASWGATGMVSFQDAPDWSEYRRYGNFLAAYLDAFRQASEREGRRLLDVLDVHWYAFSDRGGLFRDENPERDRARLDAPRSLTEAGFVESSWIPRAFRGVEGLSLPILPALHDLCARWFPGTDIAVTEFNYGGPGSLAAGLAVADALGRFGAAGVCFASHWGSLPGWLGEAYRLYRAPDAMGGTFAGAMIPVENRALADIGAYAARDGEALRLALVNKSDAPQTVDVSFAGGAPLAPRAGLGFDATMTQTTVLTERPQVVDSGFRIALPPRSARRYAFA